MADAKKPNVFQKVAAWADELVEWIEATFSDPELSRQIRADLGLDASGAPMPQGTDAATRAKIQEFVAKQDIDEAALAAVLAQVQALVQTGMTFADAVKTGGVNAGDVFWLLFKVWAADSLRARNPAAYGLVSLAGLITEDSEAVDQLDLAPLGRLFSGQVSADAAEVIDRISFLVGTTVVMLDAMVAAVGGTIDAAYGWDPEPTDAPESAMVAARALSVAFHIPGSPVSPVLTLIGVPAEHGGPGVLLSIGASLEVSHDTETTRYTFTAGASGAFSVYLGKGAPRAMGGFTPSFALRTEPVPGAAGRPALLIGTNNATRLEIGALTWGVEVGADHAGFRIAARRGKLVIALGQGDGFLSNLPGSAIEVPFDLGLLADTKGGVRFEGGTGIKVNLPVAASVLGVFTVQYIQLELVIGQRVLLELRGGFSVKLGPFQASVDSLGMGVDFTTLAQGAEIGKAVRFLPPKGIGLRLDAGVVKGGGYLFIDPDRGEYAGALELTFATFGIKAICIVTTKRPDGSEGWSMLLMIFGQFSVHIAYGIFLTGVGGLLGLHHRVDLEAITAGMKTGALDDILFPANPVADAPRIINRYRQIFPIEPDTLLLGPMLELAFSKPPVVYVRLGLLFEVRNALGGDKPIALTKVVLLGQLLAQLPPRDTGAPAILRLLVDIVGFYDAQEKFLMIRARLRDSFVGIEGFARLNLSGELLLAMRFGDDPSFVLSAGGFHPAFKDFPPGVPHSLERMAVSFAIGPIQMRCENYFAITSNSVQAGFAIAVVAKLGPASIDGRFSFDALLYLTPKFRFLLGVRFSVALKAFGANLCSVSVSMDLEGPGAWRARGSFSFSVLWWDVEVPFDEKWGSAPAVQAGTTSAASALMGELSDPARLLPEAPVGGSGLVTLAAAPDATIVLAHPLGRLTLRQKVVPFDVRIDRIGTKALTEGAVQFSVGPVTVGGRPTIASEVVDDHFARGQYMELSEEDRLGGKSFERFPCGVSVGTSAYLVGPRNRVVTASYEEKVLEPEPKIARFGWAVLQLGTGARALGDGLLDVHVALGASALSARAQATTLNSGGPGAATVLHDTPLVLVNAATLAPVANLMPRVAGSAAVAAQVAATSGAVVAEDFELARG